LGKFELTGIAPAARGVPQIEVVFDIDANCILNVSASDKASGRSEKITITNDKGRLSKEDIDAMVEQSKKFEEQDNLAFERVQSRNALETTVYSTKNQVEENSVSLDPADLDSLNETIRETISWMDSSQEASKEEYDDCLKEFQEKTMKLLSKMGAGSGGVPGGFPSGSDGEPSGSGSGPVVEEVD
jgi:heat shock protein 1/8